MLAFSLFGREKEFTVQFRDGSHSDWQSDEYFHGTDSLQEAARKQIWRECPAAEQHIIVYFIIDRVIFSAQDGGSEVLCCCSLTYDGTTVS